jgi:catechol 2,3-dioxygenase-like lactoylglutathione lyase family enzyme
MIDHVILPVRDYEASKRFYEGALRPLGFALVLDWPHGRRAWFGLE